MSAPAAGQDQQQPPHVEVRQELARARAQARACARSAPELPADVLRRLLAAREA